MRKDEIEIGAVYTMRMSTGRVARMRVVRYEEPTNHHATSWGSRVTTYPGRFVVEDCDKPGQVRWVTAAKLRSRITDPIRVADTNEEVLGQ